MTYYGFLRRMLWLKQKRFFAATMQAEPLAYLHFAHQTPLMRKLKDVDMWYQHNKVKNLKIAVQQVNGIVLKPGEVFSYWNLIGKPSKRKGYVDGMVLRNGSVAAGTGGGLCQLSNLIFWMTIHTPLTVIERHRHGYDVFPDSDRTQPFGSGATCFYPHGDLMIRNDTLQPFQLLVTLGTDKLLGEWRSDQEADCVYKIVEKNHEMRGEYWGGYSRHNELFQQCIDLDGTMLEERLVVENAAIMMYSPFLSDGTKEST